VILVERVSMGLNAEAIGPYEAYWWINDSYGKEHEKLALMDLPYTIKLALIFKDFTLQATLRFDLGYLYAKLPMGSMSTFEGS
jgi:hypothetical protein